MPRTLNRRDFVSGLTGAASLTLGMPGGVVAAIQGPRLPLRLSLAQWSLHRALRSGSLDHLDVPRVARTEFGLDAVEYVNQFFKDKATDAAYLGEMNRRAADHGIFQHLIMCDEEGRLGDPDPALRTRAVANHSKWVDAAKILGCLTIRVNAESEGAFGEQQKLVADGLRRLTEYGATQDINVIVENHGGLSSHGDWLAGVMRLVDHPRCGTLPDFGNFTDYDRYQGVAEMMPFAKAVSAKSFDFNAAGEETTLDFRRFLRIVSGAGFHGWIGIEYEGERLDEREGIRRTKALLERILSEG
jgi:sugar phosphate isomerase/epimerase